MKKILFLFFNLIVALNVCGQETIQATTDSVTIAQDGFALMGQTDQFTKAAADSAYMQNDFSSAIRIYEQLLTEGEAAEVYYNLGNSYYKIDDIARAILNYERALLLQPGNADIRANLEIARSKTVDKVVPVPEIFFITWINSLINCLNADAWGRVAIICFLFFLAGLGLFCFSRQQMWKKIGFFVGIFLLCISVLGNVFATHQKNKLLNRNQAIVLLPGVTVKSTPSESGTSLFILHEGHKVEVKDNSMREWKEIKLEDGKVGWVPVTAIEII